MKYRIALLLLAGLALALPVMGQTQLNGAGATFPYPMYSKWFSDYNKLHPDVQINYQSIGSGGGIRQVLNGTVDFGASDGPMTDEQLKEAEDEDPAHSHRAGRRRSCLQRSWCERRGQVYSRSSGRDFSRKDPELERSGHHQSESRA